MDATRNPPPKLAPTSQSTSSRHPSAPREDLGLVAFPTFFIGVTGHRNLAQRGADVAEVRRRVAQAVESVRDAVGSPGVPPHLVVLSPLAEGADRLVAEEVLSNPNNSLDVVLPLPQNEYEADFPSSVTEFQALLSQARRVTTLPAAASRSEAFINVGRAVLKKSDVVIALWDGKAGKPGGTAEVVQLANEAGKPLIVISTEPPYNVEEKRLETLGALREAMWRAGHEQDSIYDLDKVVASLKTYNLQPTADLRADVAKRQKTLLDQFAKLGFDPDRLTPFTRWLLPSQSRASYLARTQQSSFLELGVLVFVLPAVAVGIATLGVLSGFESTSTPQAFVGGLFGAALAALLLAVGLHALDVLSQRRPHQSVLSLRWFTTQFIRREPDLWLPLFALTIGLTVGGLVGAYLTHFVWEDSAFFGAFSGAEVTVLAFALYALLRADTRHPNEWWIWGRFLAEHQRPMLYLALAGDERGSLNAGEAVYFDSPAEAWLKVVLDSVWARRPVRDVAALGHAGFPAAYTGLRDVILAGWVAEQQAYHRERSKSNRANHNRLAYLGQILFWATPVLAAVHWIFAVGLLVLAKPLVWIGIAVPAFAGALQAVNVQREYERNARRFERMTTYLDERVKKLKALDPNANDTTTGAPIPPDELLKRLREEASETYALMMHENREWFLTMEVHSSTE